MWSIYWIDPVNKYSSTWGVIVCIVLCDMYCMTHIQNPVYYRKFRHIQAYLRPIQPYSVIPTPHSAICSHVVKYLEPCITLSYSKPYHIHNSNVYSELFQDLFWHIQNAVQRSLFGNSAIFRILAYLGPKGWVVFWPNIFTKE